jgi:DNA polymerase
MSKPTTVGIRLDYETKSATDIKTGAYKYTEDPEFGLLIAAYSPIREFVGGARSLGTPRKLDLTDPDAVSRFQKLLLNPHFEKHAFNANFERIVSSRWLGMPTGKYIDPRGWYCTAVRANVAGVFGTLDEVAKALRTTSVKDTEGKALIKFFSVPIPARAKRTCDCDVFHDPVEHPEEFARYESYCKQDVVTEADVARALPPIPDEQQAEYEMDQRINDRGFRHFKALSEAAVAAVEIEKTRVMGKLKDMTGLDNPNSGKQFNEWLVEQNYPMVSLDKARREQALFDPFIPPLVKKALILKGMASLTSVTKHKAALNTRSEDGRIRGSLRFNGAHTGREAGRGIQPQNLPTLEVSKADMRRLLTGKAGKDAPTLAKGTVRASIVPKRGHLFVTLDYNAIEARCLGWQSNEKWVQDEFLGDGAIYEATAANMFKVDKADLIQALNLCGKCKKPSCVSCNLRAKGKVSNLALGYGGGARALVTMGAEKEGIDVGNFNELYAEFEAKGKPGGKFWAWEPDRHDYPELLILRDLYRETSPKTKGFWKQCATAWSMATEGRTAHFGPEGRIAMMRDGKHNRLVLPSGRSIWYRFAASHRDPNNPDRVDRRTFIGKSQGVGHHRTDTHGGKLTENITQAIARDVLFWVMLQIEAAKMPGRLVLHVHDEVVLEVPEKHAEQVLADTKGLMAQTPSWAPGLVLKGAGDIMERYKK